MNATELQLIFTAMIAKSLAIAVITIVMSGGAI